MPTTISALIIIIVAIFPGLLGNIAYRMIIGVDWRAKEFQVIIRLIGFSIIGAVLYSIAADMVSFLPPPLHLMPGSYESLTENPENLNKIIYPYIGHLAGGFIAGVLAALGMHLVAKFSPATAYPSAWDGFIREQVPEHWVIIGLKSGDVYAGKIKSVDLSVSKGERDVVLEEPCLYEQKTGNYRALGHQYMFIPSENLYSLAVIHNPMIDERVVTIGTYLFKGEN